MRHMEFNSCLDDPNVWMSPANNTDLSLYYEYVLQYTNDALVISDNEKSTLRNDIGRYFGLK